MAKSNMNYWVEREKENQKTVDKRIKDYAKEITKIYNSMQREMQLRIDAFYERYADNNGISMAEARKAISEADLEALARKAKKYVKEKNFSDRANEEMELYNATMKINRLEYLKAELGLEMTAGFDETEKYLEQVLNDETIQEYKRMSGIMGDTNGDISSRQAKGIIRSSIGNATFSERIWNHQSSLAAVLSEKINSAIISGKGARELARDLQKAFGVSKANAERLMITEISRVQTEVAKVSYEENGNEFYEFMATGSNPCKVCKEIDGKVFRVEEMKPGVNAPPIHPRCHCTTAPAWDEEAYEAWLDGGAAADGVDYKEYKEWFNSQEREAGTPYEEWRKSRRAGEKEHEYGIPYGENAIHADKEYIESEEFKEKFNNITGDPIVDEHIYDCAKKAILDNTGTKKESMFLIDMESGEVFASIEKDEDKIDSGVSYTDEFRRKLAEANEKGIKIVAIHNHPEGTPPSLDDFSKAFENHYTLAIVAGHNGQIYEYENHLMSFDDEQCADAAKRISYEYRQGVDVDRASKELYESLGLSYNILH